MLDFHERLEVAQESVRSRAESAKFQRLVEKSDRQLDKVLEKLRENSAVDPQLLDEPATI